MGIFDFGRKQRLHTQIYGQTSGKELFKIDEYNKSKKITIALITYLVFSFTLLYFGIGGMLSRKSLIFFIFTIVGVIIWLYFNYKNQKRLKENLYN